MTYHDTTNREALTHRIVFWMTTLLIVTLLTPAHAADLLIGIRAFQRGDFAAALRELRPLAKQGDAEAQIILGGMFALGRGVPKDDVQAYAWLSAAAAQGNKDAEKLKKELAEFMTHGERARARELSREYLAGMEPHESTDVSRDERKAVIARCRAQMDEYGSAMVKACVDQDMAAYQALQAYPDNHTPFIERCVRHMGQYGWSMVKACTDQDLEAERALAD